MGIVAFELPQTLADDRVLSFQHIIIFFEMFNSLEQLIEVHKAQSVFHFFHYDILVLGEGLIILLSILNYLSLRFHEHVVDQDASE